ncbi:hypothetical protein [Dysgonomonas sp. ZJ279]|uniref:hypothetical protein n=1 Tax=Dysgonomonas sp. ZJ279 TaxID=2709796 RepID=UPI0013EA5E85|nr:hypothetical protein [Dysgonomonas sp. ZJ279]
MTIKQLSQAIDQAERDLWKTKTMQEWDKAVRHYNELKIKWCQHTGDGIVLETVNVSNFNMYKIVKA